MLAENVFAENVLQTFWFYLELKYSIASLNPIHLSNVPYTFNNHVEDK